MIGLTGATTSDHVATLRYEYADLVPRSIIPRLIVRLNALAARGQLWRTGLILRDAQSGTSALIRADYQSRQIEVRVSGLLRRDFLAVIRTELSHIHRTFEQLGVVERVPLPDSPNLGVSYEHLARLEGLGIREVFPDGATHQYMVATLLGSIRVAGAWDEKRFASMLALAVADTDERDAAIQVAEDMVRFSFAENENKIDIKRAVEGLLRARRNVGVSNSAAVPNPPMNAMTPALYARLLRQISRPGSTSPS